MVLISKVLIGGEVIRDEEELDSVEPSPPVFEPIEPAPFWTAAWDLLQLTEEDVLSAITDEDERREARIEVSKRKTYRREDPMVAKLAQLLGYPSEQMDTLWLYVQEHYE